MEVAFLDADRAAPAPTPPAVLDERTRLTVLVVAAEADLRRYVRECLRERTDLRLLEAATVTAAVALAAYYSPDFLVVDEPERGVLVTLSHLRAIVIVDDVHAVYQRRGGASGCSPVRSRARDWWRKSVSCWSNWGQTRFSSFERSDASVNRGTYMLGRPPAFESADTR